MANNFKYRGVAATKSIIAALQREKDSLSMPELSAITRLALPVVQAVLDELVKDRRVDVSPQPKTGLRLYRLLADRHPAADTLPSF
jgi:hypothetical protein